jgi:hypothetical protein
MCEHKPELTEGPIGMYHCPECGKMVLAGMPHPDWDNIDINAEILLCQKNMNC